MSLRATMVDSASANIEKLLEQICEETDRGIWLKPFRSFDMPPGAPGFDLLYLDSENHVIATPQSNSPHLKELALAQVSSVMVLPGRSIQLTETRAGDELVIGVQSEMKRYLGLFCRPPVSSFKLESSKPSEQSQSTHPTSNPVAESYVSSHDEAPPVTESPVIKPAEPTMAAENPGAISPELHTYKQQLDAMSSHTETESGVSGEEDQSERELAIELAQSHSEPQAVSRSIHRLRSSVPSPSGITDFEQFGAPTPDTQPRQSRSPLSGIARNFRHALAFAATKAGAAGMHVSTWLNSATKPRDRRNARRRFQPGLIAYYWTGSAPQSHEVADISISGFYLHTRERWMPGTMLRLTLQKVGTSGDNDGDAITLWSKVIRVDRGGVASEFIVSTPQIQALYGNMLGDLVDRKTLKRFL
ncbi:MAG: hypothetical protein KGN79_03015 [Acidobacteriota bacterium]|nr:hypothetical protein [Acidobacteriota bacterium]